MQTVSVSANMARQPKLQRHAKMSLHQWLQVPDNPRQRDTIRHATKAAKDHLSEPSLTHLEVSAAELPNGELLKLDGHTRSYLWG